MRHHQKCRGGKFGIKKRVENAGPTKYGKRNNTRHIFTAVMHNGTAYRSFCSLVYVVVFYNFLVTIDLS